MGIKRGLMVQFPCARGRAFVCKNIGDYVQSIAARQFADPVDEYVEQEEADQYYPEDKKKIKLIMNGWFQWRAENWPPSDYIEPLLISMHISPLKADKLLTEKGIRFLRENGPVGCRDTYTKDLLDKHGVPAYFSSCLTLTLGKKYRIPDSERKGFYIVDPYFEIPDLIEERDGKKIRHPLRMLRFLFDYLRYYRPVRELAKREFFTLYSPTGFLDRDRSHYRPYYKAVCFYKTYRRKFDKKLLLDAEYITHWVDVNMSTATNDQLLNLAESLVRKYASAKMVITSRIHCGLPSLGTGTPVAFIANEEVVSENGSFNTPGRLGGLLELFRVLNLSGGQFSTEDSVFSSISKFTESTLSSNKDDWKKYADNLDKACTRFMSDDLSEEQRNE